MTDAPAMPARPRADCCAVVVHYRAPELCRRAVESIPPGVEVVLVDSGSGDASVERLARWAAARPAVSFLPLGQNVGFGAACNRGIELALQRWPDLRHVLLLNPDAELEPGALDALRATAAAHPEAGAVGGRLLSGDGAAVLFENGAYRPWTLGRSHVPAPAGATDFETEFVTAALMLVDAALWRAGLRFDEGYFLYVEDLDLCRQVRGLGRSLRVNLAAAARHHEGGSQAGEARGWAGLRPRQLAYLTRNKVLFARKWLCLPQRLCFYLVAGLLKPAAASLREPSARGLALYYRALWAGLRGRRGPW